MWRVPNRTAKVAIVRAMMKAVSVGRLRCCSGRDAEQRVDRQRHGLQLQGDVGQRAGDGDDRDDGGDGLALAVAGGEEVGDRGDVLALGEAHDAQQEAPAEREQQDRAEIDGDEIVAGGGGNADAAEERPGGAVDRQRQGIDERPAVARLGEAACPVGIPREREQDTHVSQRQRYNAPAFDHGPSIIGPSSTGGLPGRDAGVRKRRSLVSLQPIPARKHLDRSTGECPIWPRFTLTIEPR